MNKRLLMEAVLLAEKHHTKYNPAFDCSLAFIHSYGVTVKRVMPYLFTMEALQGDFRSDLSGFILIAAMLTSPRWRYVKHRCTVTDAIAVVLDLTTDESRCLKQLLHIVDDGTESIAWTQERVDAWLADNTPRRVAERFLQCVEALELARIENTTQQD